MSLYFIITDLRGGYYVVMKEEKTKTSYFSKLINQRLNIPTKETQLKKKQKPEVFSCSPKGLGSITCINKILWGSLGTEYASTEVSGSLLEGLTG